MPSKAKAPPAAKKAAKQSDTAYVMKVSLRDATPPIWRRLRVASDLSLRDLHHVLQTALGWSDVHLHEFGIDGSRYGTSAPEEDYRKPSRDEREYRLRTVLRTGSSVEYKYDFGDGWTHDIEVESEIQSTARDPKAECLSGARACPPEDCGGVYGYADLLSALADPSSENHAELKKWVGPRFDPEKFDLASVNRALRGAGSAAWRRKREQFYES